MAYGNAISATLPTVSVTAGPTYATQVNAFLQALQQVVEAKVTPSGVDISADLSFLSGSTYYSASNLKAAKFHNESAALSAASYPTSLYFTGTDGNLYVNDGANRQIQITTGGAVNVSTTGGITGSGYGSGSVEVNWDSGNSAYRMRSGAATDNFADVVVDDVLLNDGSGNYVTVASPALSADYTLTLPSAVAGGSGYMVTMDASGNLGTTTTPTFSTATISTTSTFSGKATFAVEYAHPQRIRHVTAMEMESSLATFQGASNEVYWECSGTQNIYIPIPLTEGDRFEQLLIWIETSANAGTRTLQIGYFNDTVGVYTYPGGAYSTTTTTTSSRFALTLNLTDITISTPAGAGTGVGFVIGRFTGINGDQLIGARVFYSRQ